MVEQGKLIEAKDDICVLGAIISDDNSWTKHLFKAPKSIVGKCRSVIGAVCKVANFLLEKLRLAVINKVIMSRLALSCQLWS